MGNLREQQDLLLISRLEACYDTLSNAEKKIADYMRANLDEIPNLSAQKIAENSGTGPASVVRFCKSCGFSGLAELKMSLKRESMIPERLQGTDVHRGDSVSVIKQKVLSYHIQTVEKMYKEWNENTLEEAAEVLLGAKQIVVSGAGASRSSAYLLQDCLHLLGMPGFMTSDPVDEAYAIGRLEKGDVFVGFSYTGRLAATLKAMKLAKERGITTIAVVGIVDSPLARLADIVIYSSKSTKKYYFGTQNNTIGDFLIIEILYTILATRIPNLNEEHEKLHELISRLRVDE